jgi:hypothetical protein
MTTLRRLRDQRALESVMPRARYVLGQAHPIRRVASVRRDDAALPAVIRRTEWPTDQKDVIACDAVRSSSQRPTESTDERRSRAVAQIGLPLSWSGHGFKKHSN